ncbi:hypothetical protein YC2023_083137 [Brassica napus]
MNGGSGRRDTSECSTRRGANLLIYLEHNLNLTQTDTLTDTRLPYLNPHTTYTSSDSLTSHGHKEMANELTRNQMTRPTTGSSSVGSQRAGTPQDALPRSIDQSRPAYCTGLCGSGPRITIKKLSCVPCNIRVSFPATNNCSEDVLFVSFVEWHVVSTRMQFFIAMQKLKCWGQNRSRRNQFLKVRKNF